MDSKNKNNNNKIIKTIFSTSPQDRLAEKGEGSSNVLKNTTDKKSSEPSKSTGEKDTVPKDSKKRTEYAENKRWYSKAKYILQKAEESIQRGEIQTKEQDSSVAWAKNQVKIFEAMRETQQEKKTPKQGKQTSKTVKQASQPEERNSNKRNRSGDESRTTKRLKSADSKPYVPVKRTQTRQPSQVVTNLNRMPLNEVMKQHLKVSLVDTSKQDLRITPENFVIFDTKIVSQVLKLKREGVISSMPAFDASERYYGFKVITAESTNDLETLKLVVAEMGEIWPGARIEVRNLADLPRPPKVMMTLPGEHKDIRELVELLELTNPKLSFKEWRLINRLEPKYGRTVTIFRIGKENLDQLTKEGRKINFGIHKIPITVFETPASSVEDIMEEIIPHMESTKIGDLTEKGIDSPIVKEMETEAKSPSQSST